MSSPRSVRSWPAAETISTLWRLVITATWIAAALPPYRRIGCGLRGAASNFFRVLMHFGLMIVVMAAVFAEGTRLKEYLLDLSPLPDEQEEMIVDRFASISRAVFLGNGVASLAQGILGGLGF